ncbi:hypothetical protein B2J88_35845 [Rhodococcus sp. SRB_17]|nr:hypothetical protein [Rhodococcus sp. SRB_17]
MVIKLNADADLRSQGPAARIDSIGPAWPGGTLCKDGIATGVRCGLIVGGDANRINALTFVGSGGDSGGPAWVNNTQIVGMGLGFTDFIRFSAVQSSIAAQGNPAGKNFVVTNNLTLETPGPGIASAVPGVSRQLSAPSSPATWEDICQPECPFMW